LDQEANKAMANGRSKTVKIRIALAVDRQGNWGAAGWKGAKDPEAMEQVMEPGEISGTVQEYFLTIDVPLPMPKPIELNAAVVEAGEFISGSEEEAA